MKTLLGLGVFAAVILAALYFDVIGVDVNGVNWNSVVKRVNWNS